MQIKWIEDFLTLTDAGAFSRAAERRNVSQPTFSRHIQSLEEWLGVELVDRRMQGVHLTAAGRIFRGFAVDLLLLVNQLIPLFQQVLMVQQL